MTMTSLVKSNKAFRQAVKQGTIRPSMPPTDICIPPRSKRYGVVGTAFDYLVGFVIEHNSPGKIFGKSDLVADKAISILKHHGQTDRKLVRDAEGRVDVCRVHASVFVEDGRLTREFVGSLLEISQLDQLYRAGAPPRLPLYRASNADIDDVLAMYSVMPKERLTASQEAYIGPDFGHASTLVGGADADFVIDGALMDTKTTLKPSITLDMWCQVVGYYLLNLIERNVGAPYMPIDRIGIYMARFGQFCEVDAKSSIPDPEKLLAIMLGLSEN